MADLLQLFNPSEKRRRSRSVTDLPDEMKQVQQLQAQSLATTPFQRERCSTTPSLPEITLSRASSSQDLKSRKSKKDVQLPRLANKNAAAVMRKPPLPSADSEVEIVRAGMQLQLDGADRGFRRRDSFYYFDGTTRAFSHLKSACLPRADGTAPVMKDDSCSYLGFGFRAMAHCRGDKVPVLNPPELKFDKNERKAAARLPPLPPGETAKRRAGIVAETCAPKVTLNRTISQSCGNIEALTAALGADLVTDVNHCEETVSDEEDVSGNTRMRLVDRLAQQAMYRMRLQRNSSIHQTGLDKREKIRVARKRSEWDDLAFGYHALKEDVKTLSPAELAAIEKLQVQLTRRNMLMIRSCGGDTNECEDDEY